jgi:hypothetical protein
MFIIFIVYRPGARGIRRNITEVMIFPEGLCPEGNIITEGNISSNPPSGGSINDILYRKFKRIQFLISYVYLSFLFKIFEHVSFGSLKVTYTS